jgi:hypothetical protein
MNRSMAGELLRPALLVAREARDDVVDEDVLPSRNVGSGEVMLSQMSARRRVASGKADGDDPGKDADEASIAIGAAHAHIMPIVASPHGRVARGRLTLTLREALSCPHE